MQFLKRQKGHQARFCLKHLKQVFVVTESFIRIFSFIFLSQKNINPFEKVFLLRKLKITAPKKSN